jgi:hypothetical protein
LFFFFEKPNVSLLFVDNEFIEVCSLFRSSRVVFLGEVLRDAAMLRAQSVPHRERDLFVSRHG